MSPKQLLILIFLTVLGGCVGSFLNVVVYRWPRGQSVVRPGSRCPHCQHPIHPFHNIPVISWLLLRGRCRDCGGPISSRYALVEGVVAIVFLGLAVNIFGRVEGSEPTAMNDPVRWGLYVFQVVMICSLIAIYLIRRDGFTVPKLLYAAAVLAGLGAGAIILLTQMIPAT